MTGCKRCLAESGRSSSTRRSAGEFALCHRDDAERADLTSYSDAEAAVEIARYDDAGVYRPLKTAPNLRHGWVLLLGSLRGSASGD